MNNLAYLNKYLWKYRGRLFMGFIFIVLGNLFNVYAPMVVGQGVDFLVDLLRMRYSDQPISNVHLPLLFLQLSPSLADDWKITHLKLHCILE
jgi:ABC-type multidrug transport system fused ATPase/permease subunit